MENKVRTLAKKYILRKKVNKSLKHNLLFYVCKILHQKIVKTENPISVDNRYWIEKKWIKQ